MSTAEQLHQENKEQDKQIDALIDVLVDQADATLKNATDIGNEIESQIDMCQEINDHMDKTDEKINKATDSLKTVQKVGGASIVSYICIVILVLLIVAAIAIPKSILRSIIGKK
ncbi:SNARE domain containing protein [Histomonas meleagridis]|uniref:SNARE domain containing protein n=1 Tax=Histomonas meleagridis TaxID=135588 RepID=UPI00355A1AB8|nr:SNARE domain containing protein [Histomonas meleagridis]KAH0801306.1 SNARE domain containing protein [Histomonas meleagridis]